MLDLQVWVVPGSEGGESYKLGWKYYEKKVNTRRVLKASTALTWRCKLVALNQECYRRMRNTAHQVPIDVRVNIIGDYVRKLRASGYSAQTTYGIITSGVRCYYKKVMI